MSWVCVWEGCEYVCGGCVCVLVVCGGYVVNLYLCVRCVYGVCFFSMAVVCMVCVWCGVCCVSVWVGACVCVCCVCGGGCVLCV